MKILEDTGKSEVHEWQTGKAYWLGANAPGTRHQDINVGDAPIEVMVVELQNENRIAADDPRCSPCSGRTELPTTAIRDRQVGVRKGEFADDLHPWGGNRPTPAVGQRLE